MSIVRYHPWVNPRGLEEEIKNVFDRFLGDAEGDHSNVVTSQWTPRVDIKEEDKQFVIFADVPGVNPKDIEIHMDKGILTIKGERQSEKKDESERYSRVERAHGVFYRRFALPDSADSDNIAASGKHGVLVITIPKKPETTPRKIEVK